MTEQRRPDLEEDIRLLVQARVLAEQRAAALAIHPPCHTRTTPSHPGSECEWHYPEDRAECMGCNLPYPCLTARALGVTA